MESTVKIFGLKKAVGDFKKANGHGPYSPWYGNLMLDRKTGNVWTDTFYSIGRNEWKEYYDPSVINLVSYAHEHFIFGFNQRDYIVTMDNVQKWAEQAVSEYNKNNLREHL